MGGRGGASVSDAEKVEAMRDVFEAGAAVTKRVNSSRGWSDTAQRTLERRIRKALRVVLEREPTDEEIAAAGAQE